MPQAKKSSTPDEDEAVRDEIARQYVEVAFDDAYILREEYTEFVARRKANREQLRSLAAQGKLSDEQLAELEELYPKRTKSDEDSAEDATDPESTPAA